MTCVVCKREMPEVRLFPEDPPLQTCSLRCAAKACGVDVPEKVWQQLRAEVGKE